MKTTIFYFTGTGNSLSVARDLAAELGDTNLVSIAKAVNGTPDLSSERIGIVYPVYVFGMPLIVEKFLKKLTDSSDKYFFAVATYGGLAGDALGQTAKQLKIRGIKLKAGFMVKMPGNYTPLYGAKPEGEQIQMFKAEKLKVKEIAAAVRDKKEVKIEKGGLLTNLIFSGILRNSFMRKLPFADINFWADEKCIHCGTCVKVCPVDNVRLYQGKPVWMHKCVQCVACLQWCPTEAIQYGQKTGTKKRYHNPDIKLEDIIGSK